MNDRLTHLNPPTPETIMKTLLRTVALTAVALACFTPEIRAGEPTPTYVYEVYACDVPTHLVMKNTRSGYQLDSYHYSESDAIARAKLIFQEGGTAHVDEFTGHPTHLYIMQNSIFLQEFDKLTTAEKYAAQMEATTGWYAWIRTVELLPGEHYVPGEYEFNH